MRFDFAGTRRLPPPGATWSGQVISAPPDPSVGPSKTHLLPGGGVPRVHRARSPVPPRLPFFATPRSVHQFAAVAAAAYPLHRPPNAWSPRAPALPGLCYWLVASGTPLGWRGGRLAKRLGRGAVRHYCLGGCSAPSVCARRSRPLWGARAGTWCCVPPVSPFLPRVSRAVCRGPSYPGVPYPRSLVRHSMRSVRSARSVRLPLWYSPRALRVCVRSRYGGVRFPPSPPLGGVARAPRAVPVLGACRAVPRGPCPSACPAPVPCSVWRAWEGAAPSCFPPTCLGVARPPWGGSPRPRLSRAGGWVGGGGAACAPRPPFVPPGGPVGRGVVLPRSVPLPSLGRQQSGCLWRRPRYGGHGPHTAPVPGRLPSLGAARVAPWRVGAGWLVPAGAGGWGGGASLALAPLSGAAVLPGGGGTVPSASRGGGGGGAPAVCGLAGGMGGGRAATPLLSLWGAARGSLPCCPSRRRRITPRCAHSVGVAGPPRAPGAACLGGGGGGREPLSRARPCVWLVAGLCLLVVDEEVVIHTAVVGCLLRFLCVHLDAVL